MTGWRTDKEVGEEMIKFTQIQLGGFNCQSERQTIYALDESGQLWRGIIERGSTRLNATWSTVQMPQPQELNNELDTKP